MTSGGVLSLSDLSGKWAGDENFPVASRLLRGDMRARVMAFYAFARTADDIADHPTLTQAEKLSLLDSLDLGLDGQGQTGVASILYSLLDGNHALLAHGKRLLQAFRRDAMESHCHSWADLAAYCRYSAVPVGRFMLDLHGECITDHSPADALCTALQILNHIQDCAQDYRQLGRVYIPLDWLYAQGLTPAVFAQDRAPENLLVVLELMREKVRGLLCQSRTLLPKIRDPRLACEIAIIQGLAECLCRRLEGADPLAFTPTLSPLATFWAVTQGLIRGLLRRS